MKISKLLLSLVIAMIIMNTYSQSLNELSFFTGYANTSLLYTSNIGGANYKTDDSKEIGLKYLRNIKNNFNLEIGLNYLKLNETRGVVSPNGTPNLSTENLEMVSMPVFANYKLLKYFFVNGGPIVDFQLTHYFNHSQSGIGYGFGVGGKYKFNHFLIYVNPIYKKHTAIPFKKEWNQKKLSESGVEFGVGFNF